MSKIYIRNYAMICSLGINKVEIEKNLFRNEPTSPLQAHSLVDGQETVVHLVSGVFTDKKLSRNNQIILQALIDIEKDIHATIEQYGRERIGVIFGTSTSGIAEGIDAIEEMLEGELSEDYDYSLQELGAPSDFIRDYYQLGPIAYTISTACTSGARTFIEAKRLLNMGLCDAVIVGGGDSLNALTTNGFHCLDSISMQRTNSMSKNRKGINIGEGAAVFILSKDPSRLELVGVGESSDAYHISSPDPEGKGAIYSMQMALDDAKLISKDIQYINLHGTGTIKNDEMESQAVHKLFGKSIFVSSTKPLIGHTLGASGAIEAAFCLLALESGKLPIHYFDGEYDDQLPELNLVLDSSCCAPKQCMSNSYAFGGNNVSLILGLSGE